MKLKSHVKSGKLGLNHNSSAIKIKTSVRGGKLGLNHNETRG